MLVGVILLLCLVLAQLLWQEGEACDVEDEHEGSPGVDDVAGICWGRPVPGVETKVDLVNGETCEQRRGEQDEQSGRSLLKQMK